MHFFVFSVIILCISSFKIVIYFVNVYTVELIFIISSYHQIFFNIIKILNIINVCPHVQRLR